MKKGKALLYLVDELSASVSATAAVKEQAVVVLFTLYMYSSSSIPLTRY